MELRCCTILKHTVFRLFVQILVIGEVICKPVKPQVCIACVSYNRLDLLHRTLIAVTRHLKSEEPSISFEIAWVDNGSSNKTMLGDIKNEFSNAKVVLNEENQGLASALNRIYHELCGADFILTLEEDWEYYLAIDHWYDNNGMIHPVPGELLTRNPISLGMQILQQDSLTDIKEPSLGNLVVETAEKDRPILGVILRPETYDNFLQSTTSRIADTECYRYCMDLSSGYGWGSYTNGAALYNRTRLLSIGRFYGEPNDGFPDPYSEANFAFRAGRMYCMVVPQIRSSCTGSSGCNSAFRHIGFNRSTGHSHKSHYDKAKHLEWILYGTGIAHSLKQKEL